MITIIYEFFRIRIRFFALVFIVGLIVFGCITIVGVSLVVNKGWLRDWDLAFLVKLQDHVSIRYTTELHFISQLASWPVVSLLLLGMIMWFRRWWLVVSGGFYVLGMVLLLGIRLVVQQPAPFFQFYRSDQFFQFSDFYIHSMRSFPSGHAFRIVFISMIICMIATSYSRRVFLLSMFGGLFLSMFVMIGQIVLGHHWLTDVLIGGSLGALMGIFVFFIVEIVQFWRYRQNLARIDPKMMPAITSDAK